VSKLIERLQQASDGVVQPLGFSTGNRQRVPALAIVAHLPEPSAKLAEGAVQSGAEFVLVSGGVKGGLPKQLPPAGVGRLPWGVRTASLTDKQHAALKENDCDFAIVAIEETPVRIAADEDLDIVAVVPPLAEDRWLRALDQLPVQAILADVEPADDLTLKALMDYAAVSSGVGQSLLAPASLAWGRAEVEQLRDLGFCGIVVDVTDDSDLERLAALRKEVMALPARSRRRDERPRAHVPQISVSSGRRSEPAPDEDDDFDDD
jgi:hypothetical protein